MSATRSNNQGYIGGAPIDFNGNVIASIGFARVGEPGITAAQSAYAITLVPISPLVNFPAPYQGGSGNFEPFEPGSLEPPPPCFLRGTLIRTDRGDVPVETLRAGDMVVTMDHGLQPVVLMCSRKLTGANLAAVPSWMPVRIAKDSFGDGLPEHDLMLSAQHRVLISSRVSRNVTGFNQALLAAKKLVGVAQVRSVPDLKSVEYFHILLSRHDIIFANGLPCETLLITQRSLGLLPEDACERILDLASDTGGRLQKTLGQPVYPEIKGPMSHKLSVALSRNPGHRVLECYKPNPGIAGLAQVNQRAVMHA